MQKQVKEARRLLDIAACGTFARRRHGYGEQQAFCLEKCQHVVITLGKTLDVLGERDTRLKKHKIIKKGEKEKSR